MADQLPVIVVLTPLFAALLVFLLGQVRESFVFPGAMLGLGATLGAALSLLKHLVESGETRLIYYLGGWESPIPFGIHLAVDHLSALVLVVIAVVAFITGIYSLARVPEETPDKVVPFYTLFLLLVSGLLGMTITADAFNVFVLLEVSSLTSYGLIAMGNSKRASIGAFNYIIMGTIGASFYLLGVGYLYAKTGSLNMMDIRETLVAENLYASRSVLVSFILIMVGLWIKMAFFPLHGWLANAYSSCPSTSACILAPLVTKVSIYVMIRMMLTVFGPEYAFEQMSWSDSVVWLAVVAILAGSVLALSQKEFKRMLCYLIVAEVGYMVGGVWLANRWGMVGSIYHIFSDALMTLCLFLAAGILWRRTRDHRIASYDGLLKKMPLTMVGLLAGAFSMIGVPPTCGFFSKWYLIRGGIESGHWEYVAALLISSLVNAILFFRVIEILYFGKEPPEGHADHHEPAAESGERSPGRWQEAPPTALMALLTVAVLLVLLGIFNAPVIGLIENVLGDAAVFELNGG